MKPGEIPSILRVPVTTQMRTAAENNRKPKPRPFRYSLPIFFFTKPSVFIFRFCRALQNSITTPIMARFANSMRSVTLSEFTIASSAPFSAASSPEREAATKSGFENAASSIPGIIRMLSTIDTAKKISPNTRISRNQFIPFCASLAFTTASGVSSLKFIVLSSVSAGGRKPGSFSGIRPRIF